MQKKGSRPLRSAPKNKKGLASVILAPIRLKSELVPYILRDLVPFVNTFCYNLSKVVIELLDNIKGIGLKTIELLKKLNINTIDELINYYPFRYQIYQVTNLIDNENVIVNGTIENSPKVFYVKKNFNTMNFRTIINQKLINVTIYNRAFMKNNLVPNKKVTIIGKYDEKKNSIIASDIKLGFITNQYIESIYHLVSGLTNKKMNQFINSALLINITDDFLPKEYNYNFITKHE